VKDSKSTSGVVLNLKLEPDKKNSFTIQSLLDKGAVVINKGNVP